MKRAFFLLIILFVNCGVPKHCLISEGGWEEARQNAIIDFYYRYSKEGRFYRVDSIDPLLSHNKFVKKHFGKYYIFEFKSYKEIPRANPDPHHFPSRYIELGNRLFYWVDTNYPITENIYEKLKKYNATFPSTNFAINIIPVYPKDVFYLVNRNDITKYKIKHWIYIPDMPRSKYLYYKTRRRVKSHIHRILCLLHLVPFYRC